MSPTVTATTIEEGRTRLSITHPSSSGDSEVAATPNRRHAAEATTRNFKSGRPRGQSKGRRRKSGAGDGMPARDSLGKVAIADASLGRVSDFLIEPQNFTLDCRAK
jgi:hypothetical protein